MRPVRLADPGRRRFVSGVAFTGLSLLTAPWACRLFGQDRGRLFCPLGVQSGDVTQDRAVVWSAADRPARMIVDYSTSERFLNSRQVVSAALPETGGTGKVVLLDLPAGQEIFYRVVLQDLSDLRAMSSPVFGRLRTPPSDPLKDVSFVWSGDTAGQGWGINPEFGGMRIYEAMRQLQPDFFVHSGDMIYADNPLQREVHLPTGEVWRNVVTEEKSKVAETLEEFRGCYRYNLLDDNVRRFNAEVPQYVQWDDHEVANNWFHERVLTDSRYSSVKSYALLAARARRALFESTPIAPCREDGERIYRGFHRGPLLDLFLLDLRSYRGPNNENRQRALSPEAQILGSEQLRWLKRELLVSTAVWKVIAADMPLGLIIYHDTPRRWGSEAVAQGDGPALGRELEIADLLHFIKRNDIRNVASITADVHYAATHHFNPARAQFTEFKPFYEFVSGPLHAGAFCMERLDNTFGPQVVYVHAPRLPNPPPTAGYLHFGHVHVSGRTRAMTVSHRGVSGEVLHQIELAPETG